MSATTELELLVPCHHCGVGIGDPCVTKTGRKASDLHGDRYWQTQKVRLLFWIEQEEAVANNCSTIWMSETKGQSAAQLAYQIERNANKMIRSLSERLEEMAS